MAKKRIRTTKVRTLEDDGTTMVAKNIVSEQIEARPRLKIAREALHKLKKNEGKFVEDTMKIFRQKLKQS